MRMIHPTTTTAANIVHRICFVFCLLCAFRSSAVTASAPVVRSNVVSFSFESLPSELLTVQSSGNLLNGWKDEAYFQGTGSMIGFAAPATNTWQFFRIRATPFRSLALFPDGPTLAGGEASLPDAVAGEAYRAELSPALSGLPPYLLSFEGTPPADIELAVASNGTGHATLKVSSTGAGLVPGQRTQFSVIVRDALSITHTQRYDLRIIEPAPRLTIERLTFKAGAPVNAILSAIGGSGALQWSVVEGSLPDGLSLTQDGVLAGTPTADAAELNENGRHTNVIEVADSLTDRVTGLPAPRKASATLRTSVRLSYLLNIQATREGGPSLRQSCIVCHGPDFKPDIASTALPLLRDKSGSGAECGTTRNYIVPGDASDSLLYEKLLDPPDCGERMPFFGPYLSDQQIGRLARWIRELTPADTD